jgi:hypothetical protein
VAVGLLDVRVSEAVVAPTLVGEKATRMMQLELASKLGGQLLASTKSAAPVPLSAIEVKATGIVLLLVTVMVCAVLVDFAEMVPKLSVVAERLKAVALTPVPLKVTVWVVGVALSVKTSVADLLPVVVGAKRTRMVQLPPMASDVGQLLISANDVGLLPPKVTEVRESALVPVFVRVRVSAAE